MPIVGVLGWDEMIDGLCLAGEWKMEMFIKVVATQRFFMFTPKIGEDSQFDWYFSKGVETPN